jgi:simple sugar transport system permease protein
MNWDASRARGLTRVLFLRPETGALVGLLSLFVLFTLLSPYFFTYSAMIGIAQVTGELGIVSAGVALLMIGGEFDLSVGAVLGLSAYMYPWLVDRGFDSAVAIPLALLVAAGAGLLNGLAVVKLRISSFIVTLAAMLLWRGVILALSGGFPLRVPPSSASALFSGTLPGGIPLSLAWLIVIVAVLTLVLLRTPFGNWVFATGGNREVARNLGVPVGRVKVILFMTCSTLGGFVGIIQAARFGSVDALRGDGLELQAITTTVIGGALLSGGYGSIIGAVLGTLIVGGVQSGLVIAGAPPYYFRAFLGLVLLAAVVINMRVQRLAASR